jgi:uncharacterized repeat protein (TIGR01451 family)
MPLAMLVLGGGHAALAQTATVTATSQQACVGTLYANANNGQSLNCTSNDFATNLTFTQPSATAISNCIAGTFVSVDVIGSVTSGGSNRFDIGYYFGEVGNNPENITAGESCSIAHFAKTPSPFRDTDGDSCGDFFGSSTASLQMNGVRLLCQPQPGTATLGLPYVIAFSNNDNASCNAPTDLLPGTTAKCRSSAAESGTLNGVGVITGVTVNGYITLTKQTSPNNQPGTFAFTTTASPAVTVVPSTANLSDGGSETFAIPLNPGGTRTLTVTEAALSGWDPTASITCTTPTGASAASYVTINNTTRTITANLTAANFGAVCTITNTKIPTVKVQKTTRGGFDGPFTFAQTNLASTPADITTTSADFATPASPAAIDVSTIGTAVTITETVDSDYALISAACTDANSLLTGNAGAIGTLAGSTLTIPLGNVTPGADYTCVFTNDKRPSLQIVSISNGGLNTFTFTGGNGFAGDSITTTTIGIAATGTADLLDLPDTTTAITAAIPTGWQLGGASCTGMGGGGTAMLSSNVLTLDTAATAAGTVIVCTFTYNKTPIFRVQKVTIDNFGGPFAFSATNLASAIADISTLATETPTPASPSLHYVTTIGTDVTLSETAPLPSTYIITNAACTDANSGVTGNAGSFGSLSGLTLTIAAANVVAGADITCVFENLFPLPSTAVSKTANVAIVDDVGDIITYTIAVTNNGNVPLTDLTISDPLGSAVCTTSGNATIAALAIGSSENCTLSYSATIADFDSNGGGDGDIDNTATSAGSFNGNPFSNAGSQAVALVLNPELEVTKSASTPGPVNAGEIITYTYKVFNKGNQTITGIALAEVFNGYGTVPVPGSETVLPADDAAPTLDSADGGADGIYDTLRPGDTATFTATYLVDQADIDLLQ